MKESRLLLLALLALSDTASAAAFQLYELGTPILGTAAVGQAANTQDASAAYFNPAGMTFLPATEFLLGSQIMIPYINFSANDDNTISGDNGGNAGTLTPGMNAFFAYDYSPCLKFGLSVTSPYGGSLTYNDGFVGRYSVQTALFYTINLNPSIAYRVNQWFSIAVGGSLEYMNLRETTALPLPLSADAQITLKVDNYSGGANLGVMFTPTESTHIGIAYRSQINHNLTGNITFLRIAPQPNVTTAMVMPQNVIASLSHDFSCGLTLLAEGGWSNWASMQDTILNLGALAPTIPRKWNDTYRVGVGGRYHFSPCLTWQAGASYDSSPTTADLRLPDLPMDRQIRIGTGVIYSPAKAIQLGFSYEYWNLGPDDIDHDFGRLGTLSGTYDRNYVNTVQISVNICL